MGFFTDTISIHRYHYLRSANASCLHSSLQNISNSSLGSNSFLHLLQFFHYSNINFLIEKDPSIFVSSSAEPV